MVLRPVELPAVVVENSADGQAVLLVKGQHVVVHQGGGTSRLFASVQKPKGMGPVRICAGVQIHLPDAIVEKLREMKLKEAAGSVPVWSASSRMVIQLGCRSALASVTWQAPHGARSAI